MDLLKDRRVVLGVGALAALAAGLVIAWIFLRRDHGPSEPPPASQGGLVVESGRDDDLKLDPKRPLRCFVGGQFVGELPLVQCAQRNGVATGALDVGVDESGALAASNGVGAGVVTPLPPQNSQPVTIEPLPGAASNAIGAAGPTAEAPGPAADCWRYVPGGWRQLPVPLSLGACVQALYAGRCQAGGQALYGRWDGQTLRLTDGRVEVSADNQSFHSLADPWPGCARGPE
ncbi:MAG: hypothetical protein JO127_07995 [Caulobacteraceae bacterium]|nr:hypothetical protein [Caulobacteraceae bacterium]